MSHKLSKEIDFKLIDKKVFIELLDTIKLLDKKNNEFEYIKEGDDGFLDLYNYWVYDSTIDIETKIDRNKRKLK